MKSFYQILALKIDVTRNSYLHIGYNLREFHEPNYLMLGIGYRFNNKRPQAVLNNKEEAIYIDSFISSASTY